MRSSSSEAPELPRKERRKSTRWQWVIEALNVLANAFSMGILFQAVARWIPAIKNLPFVQGFIADLIILSDPLIYCTRGFARIIRLVGRNIFNIQFDEEKHGEHRWQAQGDIVVLALCGLAISTFFGALIPPPFNLAAAWVFGLSAVSVICYFDYIWPEQMTKRKLNEIGEGHPELEATKKEYDSIKYARKMYIATIASLVLLLVFGHMIAIVPPVYVGIHLALDIISKTGSLLLGVLNLARFGNWIHPSGFSKALGTASKAMSRPSPDSTNVIASGLNTTPARSSELGASGNDVSIVNSNSGQIVSSPIVVSEEKSSAQQQRVRCFS